MPEATSVLLGVEDEFRVVSVDRLDPGQVKIMIETVSRDGPCPSCGVLTSRVKERPLVRVKDLPASGQRVQLWWRKRRLACLEPLCCSYGCQGPSPIVMVWPSGGPSRALACARVVIRCAHPGQPRPAAPGAAGHRERPSVVGT